MRLSGILLALAIALNAAIAAERPTGRFLFQPMLIWGTSEVTHQGTGYLLQHQNRYFGVTSIHFMNFEADGLFEAIWTDIVTSRPVIGFKHSLGKLERQSIDDLADIQYDFIVLPTSSLPPDCVGLEIDDVEKYAEGTKLWFPNKTADEKNGYRWVPAEIIKDEGHMLRVRLLGNVKLQSQSGSPFLDQETGRVVGMLMGGNKKELFLCPARFIAKRLKSPVQELLLMETVKKG